MLIYDIIVHKMASDYLIIGWHSRSVGDLLAAMTPTGVRSHVLHNLKVKITPLKHLNQLFTAILIVKMGNFAHELFEAKVKAKRAFTVNVALGLI